MPYFWSDQYDVKIQCLGEPQANDIVHVVEDDGRKFLAFYERDGVVGGRGRRRDAGQGDEGPLQDRRRRTIADVLGVERFPHLG